MFNPLFAEVCGSAVEHPYASNMALLASCTSGTQTPCGYDGAEPRTLTSGMGQAEEGQDGASGQRRRDVHSRIAMHSNAPR